MKKEFTVTITAKDIQDAFLLHGKNVTMEQAEVLLMEYASNYDCPLLGGNLEDRVVDSFVHFAKTEDLSEYVWDDPSASAA